MCPNADCGRVLPRCDLPAHRTSCPHETTTCSFASLGCEFKVQRGENDEAMERHRGEATARHLRFAVRALLAGKVPPRVFKMAAFDRHKSEGETWYSPDFYSHVGGYRMCLAVAPGGQEKGSGTHLSVYVALMRGQYDEQLVWPFRGEVVVELLNQARDRKHHSGRVLFQQLWVTEYNGRVLWGERSGKPWGLDQFLGHDKLLSLESNGGCQFLKDDCLYFRVSSVKVEEINKPWLIHAE